MRRGTRRAAVLAVLFLVASQGWSHDSWLSPSRGGAPSGQVALELATGNRYPVQEFGQSAAGVLQSACATSAGTRVPLRPLREQARWLDLAARVPHDAGQPLSCWLELAAVETEIEPRLVEVYFAEIRTSAANRQAWAALQARGLPWRESYRKFARIELGQDAQPRPPAGLDLEIVLLGEQPIAPGRQLEFQVLRDSKPFAGFPVELVSERSALGIWRETDTDGKLRHNLPFPGRWLLRGTDLRPSTARPDTWESRFVTLTLEAR
jgi:hypothetical protein